VFNLFINNIIMNEVIKKYLSMWEKLGLKPETIWIIESELIDAEMPKQPVEDDGKKDMKEEMKEEKMEWWDTPVMEWVKPSVSVAVVVKKWEPTPEEVDKMSEKEVKEMLKAKLQWPAKESRPSLQEKLMESKMY
jgi:hypothetical protein